MGRRRIDSLGVDWYLPGRKRRFATTTKATCDLIVVLASDGGTVAEVLARINFDDEAKAVLAVLCDAGYADTPCSDLVA